MIARARQTGKSNLNDLLFSCSSLQWPVALRISPFDEIERHVDTVYSMKILDQKRLLKKILSKFL